MTKLVYMLKGSTITFYTSIYDVFSTGSEIATMSLDQSPAEFESLFAELAATLRELPPEEAPYTANDIFYPSGRLRGIRLNHDAIGNLRTLTLVIDGQIISRIDMRGRTRHADLTYVLLRLRLKYNVPEDSITAILMKTSLDSMISIHNGKGKRK